MPDDPYSLSDLARLADVTPRTVRYYIAQGLLPSPEVAGPATRYGEQHLARLRLIRRLQRDHLPLAQIRARLASMTDSDILVAAGPAAAEPPGTPDALDYVHELMASSGVAPTLGGHAVAEAPARYAARTSSLLKRVEITAHPLAASAPVAATPAPAAAAPTGERVAADRTSQPDRSTWERLVITPDVELHVRRPLDRHTNRRVEQLERIARELLRDDV
jgi:DNA-binding transcriptional MerR regulator